MTRPDLDGAAYPVASETEAEEREQGEETWDDWDEETEESMAKCLFCDAKDFPKQVLQHVAKDHGLDYFQLRKDLDLEFYDSIRLINYVRKQVQTNPSFKLLTSDVQKDAPYFTDDQYLQPVIENDALLFGIDEDLFDEEDNEDENGREIRNGIPTPKATTPEAGEQPLNEETPETLRRRAMAAEERVAMLERAFEEYKEAVRSKFLEDRVQTPGLLDSDSESVDGNTALTPTTAVPDNPDGEEDYYFASYSGMWIHETMLKDRVRTEAYRDFMYLNKGVFQDKIVLDIGCGSGILSCFAAKAGARLVIGVDNSSIIEKARANVWENGLQDTVKLVKGKAEEVDLRQVLIDAGIPVPDNGSTQIVDIIVSEWMGYFLLFEGMLDSVLVGRDKWLKPSGVIVPSKANIQLGLLSCEEYMNDKLHYWNDVYGFKMSVFKDLVLKDGQVEVFEASEVINKDPAILHDINILSTTIGNLDFESDFELESKADGKVHGFVGWFDCIFDDTPFQNVESEASKHYQLHPVVMSTDPMNTPTHWKQTGFLFKQSIDVKEGDVIKGHFVCRKSLANPRELDVVVKYRHVPKGSDEAASKVCEQSWCIC